MKHGEGAFRSASGIHDDILQGRSTATSVLEDSIRRIERLDPSVGAFLHCDFEGARTRASDLDRLVKKGSVEDLPLLGVPIAIKDNICVKGMPNTCGSRMLEGFRAPYQAHVIERLLEAGAVLVGKTNLDEFAMGSSTENSAFQVTHNPHDLERVPGGSSGGSAAAVAAGMVPLALGSDTGGSIRQPAALCGVVGFKPTYGTVSRYGLVAFASSLDQIGPFGASVLDVARISSVIVGKDHRDSTSVDTGPRDFPAALSRDISEMRIGVHRDHVDGIQDPGVRNCVETSIQSLRDAGARIVRLDDIDLLSKYAVPSYYIVATSEASSNLSRFDGMRFGPRETASALRDAYSGTRGKLFGEEVRRRILLGTFALSSGYHDAYYRKALQVRRLFMNAYTEAFSRADLIVGATSPVPAFPLGQKVKDPLTMYQCDVLTIPPSLAGLPSASVPCGNTPDGLPVGLQVTGPPLGDSSVLSLAFAFEQQSGLQGYLAPMAENAS